MRRPLQFAFGLAACLAAGCASRPEPIVLLSSPEIHPAGANAILAPSKPSLDKADEEKIQRTVFSCLLERHFWEDDDCSAVFLQAGEAVEKALIEKYPRHQPPLKPSYHAQLRDNQTPLDRDTGRPAMILSVDVSEPNDDGSVTAIGRWYAGGAVSGFYAFTLVKSEGDWRIQTLK